MSPLKENLYKSKIQFLEKRILELEERLQNKIDLEIENKKEINQNKKDEVIQSLEYLKSKEVKTKQDQISIYTLEVILKGMK
jgi:hypothetical protein